MKKVTDRELMDLIEAHQTGYSKTLNYEDPKRSYDENNKIRWAREKFNRMANIMAFRMALELVERRKNEIQIDPTSR